MLNTLDLEALFLVFAFMDTTEVAHAKEALVATTLLEREYPNTK
jgi:hypothetical protein